MYISSFSFPVKQFTESRLQDAASEHLQILTSLLQLLDQENLQGKRLQIQLFPTRQMQPFSTVQPMDEKPMDYQIVKSGTEAKYFLQCQIFQLVATYGMGGHSDLHWNPLCRNKHQRPDWMYEKRLAIAETQGEKSPGLTVPGGGLR